MKKILTIVGSMILVVGLAGLGFSEETTSSSMKHDHGKLCGSCCNGQAQMKTTGTEDKKTDNGSSKKLSDLERAMIR